MVTNSAEDSAASFDIGPVSDSATQRTQPMRAVKLHRRIVVDANNLSDPDPTASDSSGNSSMASNDASSHTDSGDSTSTGTPSTTTSSSSRDSLVPAAPPTKTFGRRGVPSKPAVKVACIDVDDSFPVFVFVNPWTGLSSLIRTNKSQPRSGWRQKPKKFKNSESNSPEWQ